MSRVAPPKVVCVLGEPQSRRLPRGCVQMRAGEMAARLDEIRSADVLWLWHTAWDGALEAAGGAAGAGEARIVADIADAAHGRFARLLEAADIWTCASDDIARALPRLCKPMHVLPEPPDARRMELLLDQWLGDAARAARAFALEHA